jgi:ABC-type glutathione transport system ATPase component
MNKNTNTILETDPLLSIKELTVKIDKNFQNMKKCDENIQLPHPNGFRDKIIDSFDLTVEPGKAVILIGESGSGKSTLAKAIFGILDANMNPSGSIEFKDKNLLSLPPKKFNRIKREDISILFQDHLGALDPFKSVKSALFSSYLRLNHDKEQSLNTFLSLLNRLGVSHPERVLSLYPHELNMGLSQSISLALALKPGISLLVADEPDSNLSVGLKESFAAELISRSKDGLGILLITHDFTFAKTIADKVVVIKNGLKMEETEALSYFQKSSPSYLVWAKERLHKNSLSNPEYKNPQNHYEYPFLLEARGISKKFTVNNYAIQVLRDINFSLKPGETMGLVGESGAGKSTLGKILINLITPDFGQVLWKGKPLNSYKSERPKLQMAFPATSDSFNPHHTIFKIIAEPLKYTIPKHSSKEINLKVSKIMEEIGLPEYFLKRLPSELSGGERQCVSVARAFAADPEFVVLDEPTINLDSYHKDKIFSFLKMVKNTGKTTLLFITHDLSSAKELSDVIMVLHNGWELELFPAGEIPIHPVTSLNFVNGLGPVGYTHQITDDDTFGRPIDLGPIFDSNAVSDDIGCCFKRTCPLSKIDLCEKLKPSLQESTPGHFTACHYLF